MGYGKERPCRKCTKIKLIQARGLCQSCFSKVASAGQLDLYPPLKRQPRKNTTEDNLRQMLHQHCRHWEAIARELGGICLAGVDTEVTDPLGNAGAVIATIRKLRSAA